MIPFGGAVLSGGSGGLCSLAHVSGALGMKHLVSQFGSTLTSTCLGLGLIYLVISGGRDAHLVFGLENG
jgi:hypothetical protein